MDTIIDTANKLLKICKPQEVEIEARIRKQLINKHSAKQLIEVTSIQWNAQWNVIQYLEKKKISKHNRKCTYRQRNNDTICKSSIAKTDINDLWCTVHVSIETSMPHAFSSLNSVASVQVIRYKTTYNNHYIDVIHSDDDIRIEVEVCNAQNFNLFAMFDVIQNVCAVLQMSPYMTQVNRDFFVSYYDSKTVLHIVNTAFGPFCIGKKRYQKPLTMTINVLRAIEISLTDWVVTPKVDGFRRFLICFNKLVYSVGIVGDVVYEGTSPIDEITIMDCEYVNKTYYIFDIPVYNGKYYSIFTLDERLDKIEEICEILALDYANIQIKPYEKFDSFDKLCKTYDTFLKKYTMDGLIYMDGLIFANTKHGYMQKVAKWKLNSTVDLDVNNNVLMTCDEYQINIKHSNLPEYSFGVWEFAYDSDTNLLMAHKQRYDKPQANSMHIVSKNIYNSVPGTLFTGRGFYLMRKYHNIIKKNLLTSTIGRKTVILDIGTGQGGDVNKWKKASKVFCVEPEEQAISELRERLHYDTPQIIIINKRLADLDLQIIDTKVDLVTAFFCMNQWMDDDWMMLEEIIKAKGSKKCMLLVIAMTDPREHKSPNLEIKMLGIDKYNISIHGTRIVDIDEKTVSATKLTTVANRCGLKLEKQQKLVYDFMTKDERRLSAMYTLFIYQK
jgi:hypothetical protein